MLTAQKKADFLNRFKDATIPVDIRLDTQYPTACHVFLDQKPEVVTNKVVWSGAVEYASGTPRMADSPDVVFIWAAVSFIQCTDTGDVQVGQVLFPGSWTIRIYGKWLVLWHKGTNVIKTAHERYGLAAHRLVNRERGLLLARHENLDETIGTLIHAQRTLERYA